MELGFYWYFPAGDKETMSDLQSREPTIVQVWEHGVMLMGVELHCDVEEMKGRFGSRLTPPTDEAQSVRNTTD